MSMNKENFNNWYVNILRNLFTNQNAGFIILMVAFPLLERYLREKSGIHEDEIKDKFYAELLKVFPELDSEDKARDFWQVYRNGLLHQVTISLKNRKGVQMPLGWVSSDVGPFIIYHEGNFWVHPSNFAENVIRIIENDFSTFEGLHSVNHPLPVVHTECTITLGTSTPNAFRLKNPKGGG